MACGPGYAQWNQGRQTAPRVFAMAAACTKPRQSKRRGDPFLPLIYLRGRFSCRRISVDITDVSEWYSCPASERCVESKEVHAAPACPSARVTCSGGLAAGAFGTRVSQRTKSAATDDEPRPGLALSGADIMAATSSAMMKRKKKWKTQNKCAMRIANTKGR